MKVDPNQVSSNLRRNLASNYIALMFRIVRGMIVFRLLYQSLTSEEFGYWALMWSVFGYGVLLDFGFGITVQKSVAQLAVQNKWDELNRTLSTILILYLGIGAALILIGIVGAGLSSELLEVSIGNADRFSHIFMLFVGVMGLMFPLAVFPEVLRGQQRIALVNGLYTATSAVGLCMICFALWMKWGFLSIVCITLAEVLVSPLICTWLAFTTSPALSLSPRLFSSAAVREASRFSFVAYFIMVSYMIMTKTDLLVIGAMLSVSAAAVYQPGAKLAELYSMLIRQLANVLQPAAAHLYAKKDQTAIQKLLTDGIRYSGLIATPLYLVTAFYLPVLLRLLTGVSAVDDVTSTVGQLLLLWSFSFVLTHNVYKGIAVMGGHERKLLWVGVLEAVANLGLSIALVKLGHGLQGVALGTLVPAMLLGWLVLWRWAALEAGSRPMHFFKVTLGRTFAASLPLLLTLCLGYKLELLSMRRGWLGFGLFAAFIGILALGAIVGWGLRRDERAVIAARLPAPMREWMRI